MADCTILRLPASSSVNSFSQRYESGRKGAQAAPAMAREVIIFGDRSSCDRLVLHDGQMFNLSAMTGQTYKAWDSNLYEYTWNLCDMVNFDRDGPVPVYQEVRRPQVSGWDYQKIPLGYLPGTIQAHPEQEGVMISFENPHNRQCVAQGWRNRKTNISILCSASETRVRSVEEVGGNGGCVFDIVMESKHACPVGRVPMGHQATDAMCEPPPPSPSYTSWVIKLALAIANLYMCMIFYIIHRRM
eukprot:TRINITY_DN6413_c0_g1_i1.p1 TRINITY_DN6413_c0_g1~~TRINITY_DN6413_c0_g1_i1.p1  ORF type:complete len:270 (-),score=16.55 TRINITY_DN6413_c0_g1_i1:80-811(-)